jgi:hypothetical protein
MRHALLACLLVAGGSPLAAGLNRWTPVGPEGGRIWSLAADPDDPDVLYAATGAGVWTSRNRGGTWQPANEGLTDQAVLSLAIAPSRTRQLYAGTFTGRVFRTSDGAASWSDAGSGLFPQAAVASLVIDPRNPDVVYAGTAGPERARPSR